MVQKRRKLLCHLVFGGCRAPDFPLSPLPPAATFMEHWKRKQMRLNYRWDLTGFEEEEVSGWRRVPLPSLRNSQGAPAPAQARLPRPLSFRPCLSHPVTRQPCDVCRCF